MLVLDTDKLSDFCKTLEVLGPEHSKNVLRFVQEVLRNTISFEQRMKKKQREVDCLMESLDEMQEACNENQGGFREPDRSAGTEACNY